MRFKDIESIKYQSRRLYKIKIYNRGWTHASLIHNSMFFYFNHKNLYDKNNKQNSPHIIKLPFI